MLNNGVFLKSGIWVIQARSLKMTECDISYETGSTTPCQSVAIVSIALSCTIFSSYLTLKNVVTLMSHSMSLEMAYSIFRTRDLTCLS